MSLNYISIQARNKGFTLVELAIVLVVIGLLVGGVLQGQELIQQAKLRKVIRQISSINTSAATFTAKYNTFPGNLRNATMFWSARTDCVMWWDGGFRNDRIGNETCNGNGDGVMQDLEAMYFWEHLENAGLIEQHFPKPYNDNTNGYNPGGTNYYVHNYETALPNIRLMVSPAVRYWEQWEEGRRLYILGSFRYGIDWWPSGPDIMPNVAEALDSKMDDGKPRTGSVRADRFFNATTCIDPNDPDAYEVQNTSSNGCVMAIMAPY